MTAYTHTATGSIATAENDRFRWFFGQHSYVFDKLEGRNLYLPVGGYEKNEGWGNDPAPTEVVAAARQFVSGIDAENDRIAKAKLDDRNARMDEAVSIIEQIPEAARAELAEINATHRKNAVRINEGGDGYAHHVDWASRTGKEVLSRHGVAPAEISKIAAAMDVLQRN